MQLLTLVHLIKDTNEDAYANVQANASAHAKAYSGYDVGGIA